MVLGSVAALMGPLPQEPEFLALFCFAIVPCMGKAGQMQRGCVLVRDVRKAIVHVGAVKLTSLPTTAARTHVDQENQFAHTLSMG